MAIGDNARIVEISETTPAPATTWGSVTCTIPGILSSLIWGAYDILVTRPLRLFYFEGPIWHNQPPEEICYEMTGVAANHWTASPENIARCQIEMDRRFQSWDRTAFTVMHFSLLVFVIVKLICCCSCSLPSWRPSETTQCTCQFSHNADGGRLVTREELCEMLRAATTHEPEAQ